MEPVSNLWRRIGAWYRLNVPEDYYEMNAPASMDDIKSAEAEMNLVLPQDVVETYLIHNGSAMSIFPYSMKLSTLAEMIQDRRVWMESESVNHQSLKYLDAIEFIQRDYFWHPRWIPIVTNENGDHELLDFAPAEGGEVGQVLRFYHEEGARRVTAASWYDRLRQFAESLECGTYQWVDEECWVAEKE